MYTVYVQRKLVIFFMDWIRNFVKSIDRDLGFQGKDMLLLKNRKVSNDNFLRLVKLEDTLDRSFKRMLRKIKLVEFDVGKSKIED